MPATPPRFAEGETAKSVFATLRDGDVLVHHPYESFATSVQRFIEQAAADPNVLAIKQTLYRTSGDSPIVDALIDAAEAGKQVVVLVEIKARFDEQANITLGQGAGAGRLPRRLRPGRAKTHCKTALVVRQEGGPIRRYCHIGTGNYNPKTARHVRGPRAAHRRPGRRRRPHRPVQRADRLLPADRVPHAAGGAARHPPRHHRADRAGDRARAGRPVRPDPDQDEPPRRRGDRSTRSTGRRRPACEVDLLVRTICTLRAGVPGLSREHHGPLDPRPVPGALAGSSTSRTAASRSTGSAAPT